MSLIIWNYFTIFYFSSSQWLISPVHNFGFQPSVPDCDSSVHNRGLLLRRHWRLQKGFSCPTQSKVICTTWQNIKLGKIWFNILAGLDSWGGVSPCHRCGCYLPMPSTSTTLQRFVINLKHFLTFQRLIRWEVMGWNMIFFRGHLRRHWGERSVLHVLTKWNPGDVWGEVAKDHSARGDLAHLHLQRHSPCNTSGFHWKQQ